MKKEVRMIYCIEAMMKRGEEGGGLCQNENEGQTERKMAC